MEILFWLSLISIIYAYAGYPCLLWLLSRLRRERMPPAPAACPSTTLIIAAYNEEAVIAEKLENSLALDYPRDQLQIVVAADGSDDQTPAIVQSFASRGVELSYEPQRRGKMSALNRAVAVARGDIVVFSDANNLYARDTLRELVVPFADPSVGAVSGAKHIVSGDGALGDAEGLYWRYESFIKSAEARLGTCTGVAGEILAVRRPLFEPAPASVICDDFHTAMRIARRGFRIAYAPRALSWERVSISLRDERERRAKIVAGRFQSMAIAHRLLSLRRPILIWQVVSHKFLRPLVPLAMLAALAANVSLVIHPPRECQATLLNLAPPFGMIVLSAQAAFYLIALAGAVTEGKNKLLRILFIPTFLVSSNAAALAGLFRFALKRQSVTWNRVARHEGAASSARGDVP